jgi:hypothetical protein
VLIIDWVMRLPVDLDIHFWQQVQQFEEEKQMPYISGIERRAIERGLQQGLQQGQKEGALHQLLLLLVHRFGTVDDEIRVQLQRCTFEQLQEVQEVALTVGTLDEFARYLTELPISQPQS